MYVHIYHEYTYVQRFRLDSFFSWWFWGREDIVDFYYQAGKKEERYRLGHFVAAQINKQTPKGRGIDCGGLVRLGTSFC